MLHHIVELEGLFARVAEQLHPEGAFAVYDMIGRNGHMRWPELRPLTRRLWAMLPTEKRFDHGFGRLAPFLQDWDCAIEVWANHPPARAPEIRAEAEGRAPASTCRLPNADGSDDTRPLADVLRGLAVGETATEAAARALWKRLLGRG